MNINPLQLDINSILSYPIKQRNYYDNGGFYLIKNKVDKKCYVGKSKDYLARLRQHTFKSSQSLLVDRIIKSEGINNFDFYLIIAYSELGINFFNRKLETKIEHRLIGYFKSFNPDGYNNRFYGHL